MGINHLLNGIIPPSIFGGFNGDLYIYNIYISRHNDKLHQARRTIFCFGRTHLKGVFSFVKLRCAIG